MADTITITTPATQKVVILKSFITGGDDEAIQGVIEDSLSIDASGDGDGQAKIRGSVVREMRHKALEIVVLSVDGESEDVVEKLRALPVQDYKFVCAKVDEVTEGVSPEKKA